MANQDSERDVHGELRRFAHVLKHMIDTSPNPSYFLISLWLAAFKKRPILTPTLTVLITGALMAAVVVQERADRMRMEQARQQTLDLTYQLGQLGRTRQGLEDLMTFVEDQSKKIRAEQEALAKLSKERSELEPVVRTQREVIEQIMRLQAERTRRERWTGYAFAFLIGVVSSIVASLFVSLARARRKLRAGAEP